MLISAIIIALVCFVASSLVGSMIFRGRGRVGWFRKPRNRPAVYVMASVGCPGVFKVGYTSRRVEDRAREVSRHSYGRVRIVSAIRMPHAYATETLAHKRLRRAAGVKSLGGEWYSCETEERILKIVNGSAMSVKNQAVRRFSWPEGAVIREIFR